MKGHPGVAVDAILFRTQNPTALATFYQRAFDLTPPKWSGENHVGVSSANCYLGFDLATGLDANDPRVSVWFRVDDVTGAYTRLLALGAREKMAPDATCSPGETLAEVFDPEGNVVGLVGPPTP